MPRHRVNKMNRAMLDLVTADSAAIAEAHMSGSPLPEYNPAPPVAPPLPGKPTMPGSVSADLLSNTQRTWLQRRALWFASALQQITGQTIADPTIVEQAAYLAAVALVGDDYDPITQGITPGWTSEQWSAAFEYVLSNLAQWWSDAYEATIQNRQRRSSESSTITWGGR